MLRLLYSCTWCDRCRGAQGVQGRVICSVSKAKGTVSWCQFRTRLRRLRVTSARSRGACIEAILAVRRQRVGRQRLRDHRQGGLHSVTNLASAWLPAWPAWRSPRCWCGRLCSCSWPCAVGHDSAVLRRAWPHCCSARLRRMMGCSCSRNGLLSTVAHAVQIAAQSCRELCRTHAEHVGDAGSWVC